MKDIYRSELHYLFSVCRCQLENDNYLVLLHANLQEPLHNPGRKIDHHTDQINIIVPPLLAVGLGWCPPSSFDTA